MVLLKPVKTVTARIWAELPVLISDMTEGILPVIRTVLLTHPLAQTAGMAFRSREKSVMVLTLEERPVRIRAVPAVFLHAQVTACWITIHVLVVLSVTMTAYVKRARTAPVVRMTA
jgi:hypothetical protein